jgi:hypothetical protein
LILFIPSFSFQIFGADIDDGHNMPMVSLGDRITMLDFNTTQLQTTNNVQLDFTLIDNKTGNNIRQATYIVTISIENQKAFYRNSHSHNEHILVEFVPSTVEPYRINAYFDTLSASYIADYSSPIKIIGNIFSLGNYKISVEVTGGGFQ